MGKKKPLTMEDVNRIKRATSIKNKGVIPKGSFAATAESKVARRDAQGEGAGTTKKRIP